MKIVRPKIIRKTQYSKIVWVVMIALLVPVLLYTVFQFIQRSEEEELVRSIYDRQLESILFSVNQYCWDISQTMASEISSILATYEHRKFDWGATLPIERFLQKHSPVTGVFLTGVLPDTVLVWRSTAPGQNAFDRRTDLRKIRSVIESIRTEMDKSVRHARGGYLKPAIAPWPGSSEDPVSLLLFPAVPGDADSKRTGFYGLFVDDRQFVQEVVARKFAEMGTDAGSLIFAVRRKDTGSLVVSPTETGKISFEKQENLWILPHLDLLVTLKGRTLEQMSAGRTRRNLFLLVLVDLILISGFYYLLRNISREMALAQMKTDFVANVSHELRTPLSLIHMYAETLEMGRVRTEERRKQYYQTIVNETTRLSRLINNILDFSKIEMRKKEFRKERIRLQPTILSVLDMYKFHLRQMNAELTQDIDRDAPEVDADPDAVSQALVNLIDNAIKFSPKEKRIHVSLKRGEGDAVHLSVQDHGIGIPEAEHDKVFEKFYRYGSSLVHTTQGSGLGLSLVRHVMDIHGGRILLKSKLETGSTFTMVFPIASQGR
jgi:two-component system phosphate regulon sensor histidine kinase PhoR